MTSIKAGKKVLVLDADIVFISPFLDPLLISIKENDWVVNGEYVSNAEDLYVKKTYYDYKKIKAIYPDFIYPGYVFNTGQLFCTGGSVTKKSLEPYFDSEQYPYWKNREHFPLVDQSVLNLLIPSLEHAGKITIGKANFMLWGMSPEVSDISLDDVSGKKLSRGLIHWAGCVRLPYLKKMSRPDILLFFEDYYYSKIPFGFLKKKYSRIVGRFDFYLRTFYRKTLKKILK